MSVGGDVGELEHLGAAIDLAVANVADGGGPFGAVLVAAEGRIYTGMNRVTAIPDPTAHAEIVAIRAAAAGGGDFDLSGSVLYASCAPCPMCLAAILWARIGRVVYAARPEDAAAVGFDDAEFYRQLGLATGGGTIPAEFTRVTDAVVVELAHPRRLEPFEAWNALGAARTDY